MAPGFVAGKTMNMGNNAQKKIAGDGEVEPLEFTRKFAGGIRADIRRRSKLYVSDWTDAFTDNNAMKTLSSTLFLFFACLSPAIAFGLLFQDGCGGSFGVVEMIMSSAIAGIAWALFSGQPLCILGATGPVLAYSVVIYNMFNSLVGEEYFFQMYFWTGAWFSFFTILMAASDMCCIVKHVTKFTEEIFSGLISAIFIVEAIKPTIKNFHATNEDGSPKYEQDSAFLQAFLTFGTYALATKFASLKNSNLGTPLVRKLLSSFGVTISIVILSGLAAIWSQPDCDYKAAFHGGVPGGCIKVPFLNVPAQIEPTFKLADGTARPWIINPVPEGFPMWGIFFAILPALGFAVLGFLDQNLTTLLVNRAANNLKKPPAYHLDMLVCGAIIYPICTILCLPFPVAATVRSLTHLISLTNYEMVEIEGGGVRKIPVKVVEQRVTNFMIHVMIGLSLVLAGILKFVPKPVLLGVFLFMGVSSLNGNELFERIALWFIWDESKYPQYPYIKTLQASENSNMKRVHVFTFLQLICLGILYALKSIKAVAVVFPFFIASLVGVRALFRKFFTEEELEALDGHGEEAPESVPNTEPESPLKRVAKPDDEPETKPMTNGEQQSAAKNEELPVILGKTAQTNEKAKADEISEAV
jgi:hypothetical protein